VRGALIRQRRVCRAGRRSTGHGSPVGGRSTGSLRRIAGRRKTRTSSKARRNRAGEHQEPWEVGGCSGYCSEGRGLDIVGGYGRTPGRTGRAECCRGFGSAGADELLMSMNYGFFVLLCAHLRDEDLCSYYAAASTLWRRRSNPARPYMVRLMTFSRLICPSTGPVLQGSVKAACTASRS
jgi:hypothetical protein